MIIAQPSPEQTQDNKNTQDLIIGDNIQLKDCPCAITAITKSKTGKHGYSKYRIEGIDVFDGKKQEDLFKHNILIQILTVNITQYQLIGISDEGDVTLLSDDCEIKEDLKLPFENDELTQRILNDFRHDIDIFVEVKSAMGKEVIISMQNFKNE